MDHPKHPPSREMKFKVWKTIRPHGVVYSYMNYKSEQPSVASMTMHARKVEFQLSEVHTKVSWQRYSCIMNTFSCLCYAVYVLVVHRSRRWRFDDFSCLHRHCPWTTFFSRWRTETCLPPNIRGKVVGCAVVGTTLWWSGLEPWAMGTRNYEAPGARILTTWNSKK